MIQTFELAPANVHDIKMLPELTRDDSGLLQGWLGDKKLTQYWMQIFEKVYLREIDTWDYQWIFACWTQSCLTILPNVNLISNIGFNVGATHTSHKKNKLANIPTEAMKFPLRHVPFVIRNDCSDKFTEKWYLISFINKIKNKIGRIIS